MKKTLSFSLAAVGTAFAAAALVLYLLSGTSMPYVITLNVIAIVAGALYLALYGKAGGSFWHPYLLVVAAVLAIGAVGFSLIVEVEALGYLISGLRQWADVQLWAYFAIAGLLSWLLMLIASFVRTSKA